MRKIIDKVVRLEEIERLEKEGARPNYEIIKVSSDDISRKNNNAQQLKEILKKQLPELADNYEGLSYDTQKDIKQKVELLVDVEELVRVIGRMDNIGWQHIWETAKHLRYECGEKTNLKEFITNYIADSKLKNLCFVETAVINELNKMKFDQILFMKRCEKKRKKGYREGYYLKSMELVETDENKLNK